MVNMSPEGRGIDAEQQLADLQRKYRIMEGNRRSYSEDSQKAITQQRQTIQRLKEENNYLKTEIALHKKRELTPMSSTMQHKMNKIQESAEIFSQKIEAERIRGESLKTEIEKFKKKSMETRKHMGGVNAAKENTQYVSKQVKILENRLDNALVKFNEALAKNKELRQEIDNLRRERLVFDQIYRKLEKELQEKKQEMANVIEVSNIAYEARDQAQNEIAALRSQADKEQSKFEVELKDLNQVIDHERKVHEAHRKQSLMKATAHLEEISSMKKRAQKSGANTIKVGKSASKVQTFEEAFQKIQEATAITDIDDLVTSFIVAEDQNFSLYNYLNDLNRESEKLEEQIMEIQMEIDKYKGKEELSESHHRQVMKDFEDKISLSRINTEKWESKYQTILRVLGSIKSGIVSICNKTGCNALAPKDLLLEGVTESNMAQYLALIEQRATEIVMMYLNSNAYQTISENASEMKTMGPNSTPNISGLQIEPPSTTMESKDDSSDSEDDIDDRPLSRNELQARTLRNMLKRNERAKNRKKK